MLFIEHLTKQYGSKTVLEDITLDFGPGVYGLLAPNGAGKTTLLRMLATLLFPTRGEILWNGEDIYVMGEAYRGIMGYLPQDFGYYPSYTAREFLRYIAALEAVPRQETNPRINALLRAVGLEAEGPKKLRRFSGGMLQRVGIAAAMMNDPKLLILDEPTAGLDPKERVRFRNLIHSFAEDRVVLLSTHIVSDVESIADRIIMIRDHRIWCCGRPAEVCASFQGRVFEIPAASGVLRPGQTLLSERQSESGPVLRILCDEAPAAGTAVPASLEDAFLALYQEENT